MMYMTSRYYAAPELDFTKITLKGSALARAIVSHPIEDAFTDSPTLAPLWEPSTSVWRARFGYMIFELDPALSNSVNKTASALTDGNLGTSVSYTLTGNDWVNVGPNIDMGEIGNYLYLVKCDASWDGINPFNIPYIRIRATPPAGGETVFATSLQLPANFWPYTHEPFTFGVFIRGKRAFQLQAHPRKDDPTLSDLTLTVYEISIYRV